MHIRVRQWEFNKYLIGASSFLFLRWGQLRNSLAIIFTVVIAMSIEVNVKSNLPKSCRCGVWRVKKNFFSMHIKLNFGFNFSSENVFRFPCFIVCLDLFIKNFFWRKVIRKNIFFPTEFYYCHWNHECLAQFGRLKNLFRALRFPEMYLERHRDRKLRDPENWSKDTKIYWEMRNAVIKHRP